MFVDKVILRLCVSPRTRFNLSVFFHHCLKRTFHSSTKSTVLVTDSHVKLTTFLSDTKKNRLLPIYVENPLIIVSEVLADYIESHVKVNN
jgi:hypothetical protein